MNKIGKLYSVRGYQHEEFKSATYVIRERLDKDGKVITPMSFIKCARRKLVVLGTGLKWADAKKMAQQYASAKAAIFPNVLSADMKVVQL